MLLNQLAPFIGYRYFRTGRRSRKISFISVVALLGLVLGTALLIVVLSVMNGFDRELRERILGFTGHLNLRGYDPIEHWQPLQKKLQKTPGIKGVAPFIYQQGMLVNGQHMKGVLLKGIHLPSEINNTRLGEILDVQSITQFGQLENGLLLSHTMANKLNLAIGDNVVFLQPGEKHTQGRFKTLTVAGLFASETELDQIQAFTALSTLQSKANVVEGFQIHLTDIFAINPVALQIRDNWPFDYYLNSWMQSQGNLYSAIQLSKRLVMLVMLAVIGVAVFNLMTTLTLVVIDKRSSIAILKTMGISRAKVLAIFITQGALIGFLGVLLGALLGVGLSLGIEQGVSGIEDYFGIHFLNTDVYPIDFIPSDIRWQDVSLVAALAWLLAILSTLYPAWRATKIEPSTALQSDY